MKTFSLTFGVLALTVCFLTSPLMGEVAVGDKSPDFKLEGSDGKTYSNKQFEGEKVVVIAWFPKAFTGGCTKECKSLRENGEILRDFDVAYFTASVDDAARNTEFAKSLDLDYPILSDPSKMAAKAFGCLNDRGVTNRWTYYIGKDGKILYIDKKVKAAAHGEDIAKRLESLGVEQLQTAGK